MRRDQTATMHMHTLRTRTHMPGSVAAACDRGICGSDWPEQVLMRARKKECGEKVVACGGSSIWVGSGSSAHLPRYTLSVGLQARCWCY